MTRYVIAMTITPDPPSSAAASQLTVRVDTSSGRPRVSEVVVRSGDARGLGSADLPAIDLGLLVQALSGGPAPVPATASVRATRPARSARSKVSARSAGAASARVRGRRSRTEPEPERAYRRMPEASEVLKTYKRVGTITGLAAHYGVPRHTAQGWAGRLRREGHQIGRG
jgi:hypothetical protein